MTTTYVQQQRLQNAVSASDERERQKHLRSFAQTLAAEIFAASPEHSEEILSTLIAELAMSAADQRRKAERRQKQAEGIAAAQARGVRFGRRPKPLPDNFENSRQAWLDGKLSLRAAAESCGMEKTTFQRAASRPAQDAAHIG